VTGINPGEVVPTTGFDKLQDGSAVKIEPVPAQEQATNHKAEGGQSGSSR
jgi:multidrug efflux system membrane fusion protein